MTARGIKVNHDGTTVAGMTLSATDFVNTDSQDATFSGWFTIRGAASGNAGSGQVPFGITCGVDYGVNGGIIVEATDPTGGTPWSERGRMNRGGATDDVSFTPDFAQDELWFWCLVWSGSTGTDQATWYWAKDQAVSLTSGTGASGWQMFGANQPDNIYLGYIADPGLAHGSNLELTNVKIWIGTALTSTQVLAEMKNEAAQVTSNLYAHWKLASAADTLDYSGNSRTLTTTGTVTDGTMDPVDIRAAVSANCTWYGILKA